MFGFIIGTVSLLGLLRLWKGGWHPRHGWGHGGPRRWMTRRLFEYLETSPGQERVLAGALEEVEKRGWAARDQLLVSRAAYARAVRGEHFDGAAVGEAFDGQQTALEELKKAVRDALAKAHEALEPEQRRRLAELIERGPRAMHGASCGGGWGGPGAWRHHAGPSMCH